MKINEKKKSVDRISLHVKFYFSKRKIFSRNMLMQIRNWGLYTLALFGLSVVISGKAAAVAIMPTNLDDLDLGAMIVGPVGPTVDTTFVNSAGEGIADLSSGVSCPQGFDSCVPANNQGIPNFFYTYIHVVTPDNEVVVTNDPPFPPPDTFIDLQDVSEFRLNFSATGFNGIAGFSSTQVENAGVALLPTVEQLIDGTLLWDFGSDSGWDQGESISFFWQTTQPPSGPGGVYALSGRNDTGLPESGSAAGPVPQPLAVPEPTILSLLVLAAFVIGLPRIPRFPLYRVRGRLGLCAWGGALATH